MLNNGTILTGIGDIMHLLIFGKTRAGEVLKDWESEEWYGTCRQCKSIIESFRHIFGCDKVKEYLDDLSISTVTLKVYSDHYLWHSHKEKPRILAQFAVSSLFIAATI